MNPAVLRCLLPLLLLFCVPPARADFTSGQRADLVLGELPPDRSVLSAYGLAVDPVTHKVFVADQGLNRILRFTDAEAFANGGRAEAVLGQPDMDSADPGLGPNHLSQPSGIALDDSGRLWVADTYNHRVLRFDNAVNLPSGASAAAVLGQPGFFSNTEGVAANQMNKPGGVSASRDGRVWVADALNSRVLRFDNAAALPFGANASGLLGKSVFGSNTLGHGAAGLSIPRALVAESGLAAQGGGWTTRRLWVADSQNNRVLRFDDPAQLPNGGAAAAVLGQPDFASSDVATSRSLMTYPDSIVISGGNLWVGSTYESRVLLFERALAKPSGGNADLVLGQAAFTTVAGGDGAGGLRYPSALAVDGNRLWIGDTGNSRVVRHENALLKANGNAADGVIGQSGLAAEAMINEGKFSQEIYGLVTDPVSGKLFVSDSNANRVLRFPAAAGLTNGSVAEAVFGQTDFITATGGTSPGKMLGPRGMVMDRAGHLWVADMANHRVLRFDNAATAPSGSPAVQVLGQVNFTSGGAQQGGADRMYFPWGLALELQPLIQGGAPVARRLWVADQGNHRILRFNNPLSLPNGSPAAGVLGSPSLSTVVGGVANYTLVPAGICIDPAGRMWVADMGTNRVLRFDAVAQKANGAPADGVLGQPDFTSATGFTLQSTVWAPTDVSITASGRLFVSDRENHRIVWFNNAASRINGSPADGVLGQSDFVSSAAGLGLNRTNRTGACLLDSTTGRLWVTDIDRRRLLRFTPALESRITGVSRNTQGLLGLQIQAQAGELFDIRSSPDLFDWSTRETTVTIPSGTPQTLNWTAPATPGQPRRYYRLQVP